MMRFEDMVAMDSKDQVKALTAWSGNTTTNMINIDLNQLIIRLKEYQPEKVILFGSVGREEVFSPTSDIDLAIIKTTDQPFYKRNRDVRKLLRSKIPLDVFVFTPIEFESAKQTNSFVAEIEKTGRVIYEQPTQ